MKKASHIAVRGFIDFTSDDITGELHQIKRSQLKET